jgi:hypothetical protein
MAPIVFASGDVIGNGRYLQEVRIATFAPSRDLPQGLRYSFCLVELQTGKVVLLYDVHRGKSHHRHLRGRETEYTLIDEGTLMDDFLRDVALIVEGRL